MSSRCNRLLFTMTLLAMPFLAAPAALAQEGENTGSAAMAAEQKSELRQAIAEPECEQDGFQPDTIIVCGGNGADETREHMSVLPRPVESNRVILPGLNDPPCWVAPRGAACIRGGWAPPPVVLIDLDAFPDALTAEEQAQVYAVEEEGN